MCNDACRLFFAGHRSPLEESPVLKKVHALCTATAAATGDDDDDENDDVHAFLKPNQMVRKLQPGQFR